MNISFQRLIKIVFLPVLSISVFLLLLCSPVLYYAHSFHFYTSYVQTHSGMTNQSVNQAQNVYSFLWGKGQLDPAFSQAENQHLQAVKQVFHILSLTEIIALLVFCSLFLVFAVWKKFTYIIKGLCYGSVLALLGFLLLMLAIAINFSSAFTFFHQVFFPQGDWQFPAGSMLITIFPIGFFQYIAIKIFLTSAGISLFVLVADGLWKRYRRRIATNH